MQEPKVLKLATKEALVWSFENIKPEKFEKLGPSLQKIVPNISAAPIEFEFEARGNVQGDAGLQR